MVGSSELDEHLLNKKNKMEEINIKCLNTVLIDLHDAQARKDISEEFRQALDNAENSIMELKKFL